MHDDPQLVEHLRDPATVREAFGDVIAQYSEPLYRQIRGDARLSTWLYKIAVNETLSHLERERKRRGLSLDDQEAALINTIEADTDIDGDRLALRLRKAIATLPEKQRLVFNMRYYDDMRYDDISAVLGTSVGALKASYHLAVKKIEQFFSDDD